MTFKFNRSEFIALHDLFKARVAVSPQGYNIHRKLQLAVLQKLWERIYKQFLFVKPHYRITMFPWEAIAFYLYFADGIPDELIFENNLVRQMRDSIHKKMII